MKQTWLKKGRLYLPIDAMKKFITLAAICLVVTVCMTLISKDRSVGDDLHNQFIYPACTAFWWKWMAEKISDK